MDNSNLTDRLADALEYARAIAHAGGQAGTDTIARWDALLSEHAAELRAPRAHGGTGDGEVEALAEEALRLDAEATPGPWTVEVSKDINAPGYYVEGTDRVLLALGNESVFPLWDSDGVMVDEENARFIARARTLLPALARAYLAASRAAPVTEREAPRECSSCGYCPCMCDQQ